MLLQALTDLLSFCAGFNCELQIGGSAPMGQHHRRHGIDPQENGRERFRLTLPLILNADGTKLRLNRSPAPVWLSAAKTSVYRFYQFWIRAA